MCAYDALKDQHLCLKCVTPFSVKDATSSAGSHVESLHPTSNAAARYKGKQNGWYTTHSMVRVEAGVAAPAPTTSAGTLDQRPSFRPPTEIEKRQHDRAFAAMVAIDKMEFSAGERPGMQLLFESLRGRGAKPPSRRTTVRHVAHMSAKLVSGMQHAFSSLPPNTFFSAAIDLWDTKGAMISFLGTILYFIDEDFNKHVVTVGVEHAPGKHDVAAVKKALESHPGSVGVPLGRLVGMATDGGSQMPGVCAAMGLKRIWCFCHRLQLVIKVRWGVGALGY